MWAWSGAKRARLYIDLLEDIIGQIKSIDPLAIEPLAIEPLDAIDPPEFIIGPPEFIIGPPEFIGRLECVNGRLECVDPLVIGRLATEPPEFIIGLPAIEQLESIGLIDSRKADHAEVLEVPWSHDMLVAANGHIMTIGIASVSVEDNLSRGSLLDHGKARFEVRDILNHGYPLLKRLDPRICGVEPGVYSVLSLLENEVSRRSYDHCALIRGITSSRPPYQNFGKHGPLSRLCQK